MRNKKFILWFDDISINDIPLVGGKNASLGEMYCNLKKSGVRVPNGFAVTAFAYRSFIESAGIAKEIRQLLLSKKKDIDDLARVGREIRAIILNSELPRELQKDIVTAYRFLSKQNKTQALDVAVRSSATAEDLPNASFAGQQETFLNISGEKELLLSCKKCFASLFTDRAIVYREKNGFSHEKVALSIGVQQMVRSDVSGIMFTLDTESGFDRVVMINSAYGLGENIVQGVVNPDTFYVFKDTLATHKPIISRTLGSKEVRMVYATGLKSPVKNIPVSIKERQQYSLTDDEVLTLARWGVIIENYYTQQKKKYSPMDMEWAKDKRGLFIVQARPETIHSQKNRNQITEYNLQKKGRVLVTGRSVGTKIATGKVQIIKSAKDIRDFRHGSVLVTEMTDPDWVPVMRLASAIITDHGGSTCHAAIVSRELGIPCVVGTSNATQLLKKDQKVTVSCAQGSEGFVYEGHLPFSTVTTDASKIPEVRTQIKINLGNPSEAFSLAHLPVKGVGLAREEFIITSTIKVHPLALVHYDKIKDENIRKQITDITRGYTDKKQFFVNKLAEGIATIAASCYPHQVLVRLSDFKSNEYKNLVGGELFEPSEENPMIGFRGASRYYSKQYEPAFALECKAIKKAREECGLYNIAVMVPFCRTPEEGKKVLATMAKYGLKRGTVDGGRWMAGGGRKAVVARSSSTFNRQAVSNSLLPTAYYIPPTHLQVHVMCEIPSNVILAEEYCQLFDGFSIGSNDLTQLTLGLDRDNENLSYLFDENNEAVRRLIEHLIFVARKHKKPVGICGQAPSDKPEFVNFLVKTGITSISLNPDSVLKTIQLVKKAENSKK